MKVCKRAFCLLSVSLMVLMLSIPSHAEVVPDPWANSMVLRLSTPSFAEMLVSPRASAVFNSTFVILDKNKNAMFGATTYNYYDIKVSSVTLQKQNGSTWEDAKGLTAPSAVAKNSAVYEGSASYSKDIGSGTFRLKAVFSAGGTTTTSYSASIKY